MTNDPTLSGTSLPLADLQKIVASMRPADALAAGDSWYDAAITGAFSFSAGGGNLEGWISYYDGTKVFYKLTNIESRTGTAAGTFALPLVRVQPPETFLGKPGACWIRGFWAIGALTLSCAGSSITQSDIPLISAAPWDYDLKGTVSYTRA